MSTLITLAFLQMPPRASIISRDCLICPTETGIPIILCLFLKVTHLLPMLPRF